MNRDEIQQLIPHRDPFLWLDEVVEITESRIHARLTLTPDLPIFQGHYPLFPVFPGVLQIEAAFQAGAVLIAKMCTVDREKVPVATRLNNVKFRRMCRPNETLDIEVELTEKVANAFFLTGKISVGGEVSVRMDFAVAAASG